MSDSEKPKSWKERKQSIKHKWLVPFVFPEWLCEQLSYFLGQWAFLDILGHAGRLAILVAVVSYFMGADERRMQAEDQRKAKHYQAWQVINSAQGKVGDCGRKDALQDLNSDGIELAGVDISNAWLPSVNLKNANLYLASLAGATLDRADLSGVNLLSADLSDAALVETKLAGASLIWAKLPDADLPNANLSGADVANANLSFARLDGADLKDIKNWGRIRSIKLANIYGVKNAPEGFRNWAISQGAVDMKVEDHQEWLDFIQEEKEREKKK